MKIEIILSDNINEIATGMTYFNAQPHIANAIKNKGSIKGVVIIDDKAVKFSFSPMGMDGDIYSKDDQMREFIKIIIPLYMFRRTPDIDL